MRGDKLRALALKAGQKNKERKMKKVKQLLVVLMFVSLSGTLMGGACEDIQEACGPCGTVANGDTTISGDARLDGLFKAVGTLGAATGSIKANFDADVLDLAAVFMAQAEIDASADLVADLKAKIQGEITASTKGGLKVKYQEPKCSANVSVAVEASAQCEAKVDANCSAEVECTGPEMSVKCEGTCSGSCSADCEVPTCEVAVTPGSLACEGECQGSCALTLEAAAACEGKCEGECSGSCSAYVENTEGEMECSGSCDGECTGKCEVSGEASASCTGECRGSCKLVGPELTANCEGELKCEGSCGGECSGGCEGKVTAPKCEGQASCDADVSADCEAQASAQASASLECTPPSLEIGFEFSAALEGNAEAQAEFLGKMETFKVKMVAILKGFAELDTLINGNVEAGVESPVAQISAEVQGIVSGGIGDFDISAGLIPCVIPAFKEAGSIMGSVATDMAVTLKGQADLALLITG